MPEPMIVKVAKGEKEVELAIEPKVFKSGKAGYYFRDRVVLPDGLEHHVQIVISE